MPSTFTWLDYSEHERRKMLDVIELFGERTTRDELGLGGIRDAFADRLFPGTSTIQTRARYFLFVPWLYRSLEGKGVSSARIRERARRAEIALIGALERSGDLRGLVGRRKKENVQRLPSSIYWLGLATWGIRTFSGSQDEYHRSLDAFYERRRARPHRRVDFEGESEDEELIVNWDPGLPEAPEGFPEEASFVLRPEDAEYLRERVLAHCPDSLLAHLLRERIAVDEAAFAWALRPLPSTLQRIVDHGRNFSECIHGAQLLYNLILAEKKRAEELYDWFRSRFDTWGSLIQSNAARLHAWNRREFWEIVHRENPRLSPRARAFVDGWIDRALEASDPAALGDDAAARRLVEHREIQLKKGLARVRGGRALELWGEASGDAQIDLRWTAARRIVADILEGLQG